ncbi:MAG: RNA polymerase-binding protein DksA [Alphaproteobacteria bacterium]
MATVNLPPDYTPTEDEEFMNPIMTEFFRQMLQDRKKELIAEAGETRAALATGGMQEADITDRASIESDAALELRTRDRARKLIKKINQALERIEEGEYGYCDVTGDPISVKRLIARPMATMTLEAQEAHERAEKIHRDD